MFIRQEPVMQSDLYWEDNECAPQSRRLTKTPARGNNRNIRDRLSVLFAAPETDQNVKKLFWKKVIFTPSNSLEITKIFEYCTADY